jgi:hypothetical protein
VHWPRLLENAVDAMVQILATAGPQAAVAPRKARVDPVAEWAVAPDMAGAVAKAMDVVGPDKAGGGGGPPNWAGWQ